MLSEHKHCDNAATNSNSENARSRMVARLRGRVGTGTKEDESSARRVWAARFHYVTVCSRLAHVSKLMKRLFL
jgi:predicted component of type VI protein secretion system